MLSYSIGIGESLKSALPNPVQNIDSSRFSLWFFDRSLNCPEDVKNHIDNGDIFPSWIRLWISIAENTLRENKSVLIWSLIKNKGFAYQPFSWKDFIDSNFDSWCFSGLMIGPDNIHNPTTCATAVFSLESGIGLAGSLKGVETLLRSYVH